MKRRCVCFSEMETFSRRIGLFESRLLPQTSFIRSLSSLKRLLPTPSLSSRWRESGSHFEACVAADEMSN